MNLLKNPVLLPSARFHQLLVDSHQEYQDFNFDLANQHAEQISKDYLRLNKTSYFESVNSQSQKKQSQLESESEYYDLDDYIKTYLSGETEK